MLGRKILNQKYGSPISAFLLVLNYRCALPGVTIQENEKGRIPGPSGSVPILGFGLYQALVIGVPWEFLRRCRNHHVKGGTALLEASEMYFQEQNKLTN